MLQQSTPQSLLTDAAWLDAAMADFLAHGGRISTVPGFAPKPRPARFHPEPKPKRVELVREPDPKREAELEALKELALKGYTLRYARRILGFNELKIQRLAKELMDAGILFREPPPRREP